MKGADNLMSRAHAAPRCTAKSKRTKVRCGAPAMRERTVCYHHGGRAGAPRGARNGAYKHGHFTCEAIEARQELAALLKAVRGGTGGLE